MPSSYVVKALHQMIEKPVHLEFFSLSDVSLESKNLTEILEFDANDGIPLGQGTEKLACFVNDFSYIRRTAPTPRGVEMYSEVYR